MKLGSHKLVHPTTICTAIRLINSASVVGTPGIPPSGVNPMRLVAKRSGAKDRLPISSRKSRTESSSSLRPAAARLPTGHEDCVVSLPLPFSDLPDVKRESSCLRFLMKLSRLLRGPPIKRTSGPHVSQSRCFTSGRCKKPTVANSSEADAPLPRNKTPGRPEATRTGVKRVPWREPKLVASQSASDQL